MICAVLGCGIEELLLPEPAKVAAPGQDERPSAVAGEGATLRPVTPKPQRTRSLPPR